MKLIPISFLALQTLAAARDPAWFKEKVEYIAQSKDLPKEESLPKLGTLAAIPARGPIDDEQRQVATLAQAAILEIPGYAEYFSNDIKNLTDAEIAGTSRAHTSKRGWEFETLSQLKGPETVRVLGEFLFDERDPFKDDPTDAPWTATCWYAENAIFRLGLSNPPVAPGQYPNYREDLHTWQLWYEQVKAGTRTFSFKGDNTVYTLAGPVKDKPAEVPVNKLSPPVATAVAPEMRPQSRQWPLIVALLVVAGSVFAVVRNSLKRRSKAG